MTRSELEALIDGGSIEACLAALEGMPEAERPKLGAAAVARLRALGKGIPARIASLLDSESANDILPLISIDIPHSARYRAARGAVLATSSFSQWKGVKSHGLPSNELAFRILSDRKPEWLDELIEFVCDEEDQLNDRWPLIRRLVREGYCGAPRRSRYIDRMMNSLQSEAWASKVGLKDVLLGDPGLLEHEIWRIFETEPGRRAVQLFTAGMRGVPEESAWEVALPQLASDGNISRDRLLDATLDGLSRDLHDMRARWFAVLHDRLKPTLEERAARGARYLDFLGSRNPSTIVFALMVLKDLLKSDRLDPGSVVDRLAPALHSRLKGTVKQALALLELAVRRTGDSVMKNRAVIAATGGLVHEAADVQAAILDFIERHGDSHDRPLADLVAARRESIAVSLRGRLAAWLELREEPTEGLAEDDLDDLVSRACALDPRLAALAGVPEALAEVRGERSNLPALRFDGTEIPRLDPARLLEPINDLDTLIEQCSRLIEDLMPVEDVDRCVDAISRLCDQRPADFEKRTAPLAARVKQRLDAPLGMSTFLLNFFGEVIKSWLTRRAADPHAFPFDKFRMLDIFISNWVFGIARRVGRAQAAPLLAAPTHVGGWIDPRVLVERFRRRCKLAIADEPADLVLAILRLAPDHRSAALADARELRGEQGAAIRHALGAQGETIGPSAALWVAAARARSPWADDPAVEARHPLLGPDAGRAASYHIDGREMIRREIDAVRLPIDREPAVPEAEPGMADLPTVSFHCARWLSGSSWPSPAWIWPSALESFFAAGAQQLIEAGERSSDWQGSRGFLLPLLDPDVPIRAMARLLLAIGLNAKLPEIAGLATDALIGAIDDGRLDAENLGQSLRIAWQFRVETAGYNFYTHVSSNTPVSAAIVIPLRWAKTLGDVARSSVLHASVIARAVELFVVDETSGSRTTVSLLPLLELLREASVESGRAVSAAARAYLGGLGTGGKTGRVVSELLALREVGSGPAWRKAQARALASRVARAERWMEWER
jgi:Family of unknown function (DUF6493)